MCLEVDSKEIIGFSEGGDALEGSGRVCTAKAGEGADGEQCNSCFVCADGGITFDCTNVSEGMISSTCTDIGVPIPTTFWEVIGSADIATTKAKYPELDG